MDDSEKQLIISCLSGFINDTLGLQKVLVEKDGVVLTRGVVVSRAGVHKHLQIHSANIDLIS